MQVPVGADWQREILDARNGMVAKMMAKKGGRRRLYSRPDFDDIKVEVMRWCLRLKLAQHWVQFGKLLLSTGSAALVEASPRDWFWGSPPAKGQPSVLRGSNHLGRLLSELREQLRGAAGQELRMVPPVPIADFLLLGQPIRAVDARSDIVFAAEATELTREQAVSLGQLLRSRGCCA